MRETEEKIPEITIAIPAYNVEDYLDRCMESVESQTDKNFAVLICDDGSTDETYDDIRKWAEIDHRVRFIRHKTNKGLAEARNSLLANTETEFIFWLDANDTIAENTVEELKKAQQSCNADIVRLEFQAPFAEPVRKLSHDEYMNRLLSNRLRSYMGGSLFRKSLFDVIRFPKEERVEDYPVHPFVADKARNIVILSEGLYHYTVTRQDSLTVSSGKQLSGLRSRAKGSFLRYRRYHDSYPEACEAVLRQAVDYGVITAIMAYKENPGVLNEMKSYMEEEMEDIRENETIHWYKKTIVKWIINRSPMIRLVKAAYMVKRNVFGAR